LGVNYLPDKIEFTVKVGEKISEPHISHFGTGAGRPSGGPAFNCLLDSHFHEKGLDVSLMSAFADDSQVKTCTDRSSLLRLLGIFLSAQDVGLKIHTEGQKAPSILTHSSVKLQPPKPIIQTYSTTFLGVDIYLSSLESLGAKVPSATIQKMFFLVNSLGNGLHLARLNASIKERMDVFKNVSNSVACLLENRIQYFSCFTSSLCLYKMYTVHRLAICFLLDIKISFFCFKTSKSIIDTIKNFKNPFDAVEIFESDTYKILCKICNRPNFSQILLRGCTTVLNQSKFDLWNLQNKKIDNIRPRLSPFQQKIQNFYNLNLKNKFKPDKQFLNDFLNLCSLRKRRVYLRTCTKRLFLSDLKKRGFDIADESCKACKRLKMSSVVHSETHKHFIKMHLPKIPTKKKMKMEFIGENIVSGNIEAEDIKFLLNHVDDGDILMSPKRLKSKLNK